MSIRVKLLLGFSAVLCLTVLLALQALWSVRISGDLVTRVYDEPLQAISAARSASAAFQAARAEIAGGGMKHDAQDNKARLQAVLADINGDISVVRERIKSQAVQATLDAAVRSLTDWHKAMSATFATDASGVATLPTPQALERLSAAVSANLDDLAEQVAARGYEMRTQADDTIRITQIALLGVIGFAAALGALLGLLTARGITKPLAALSSAMQNLASGAMEIDIPGLTRRDEFAPMARSVQSFKDGAIAKHQLEVEASRGHERTEQKLREMEEAHRAAGEAQALVLKALGEALERLAQRDLITRIEMPVAYDYQKLKDNFNAALEQLERAIHNVNLRTQAIEMKTRRVGSSSDDLSRRTEQQAASIEQAAAALGEITETIKKTAEGASRANKVASDAASGAETGRSVVRQAIAAMAGIEKSSQTIGQIIGVIDEIAFQTNLLAVNAGVEAARAGDAGRGFAVVASEVRALAQRSADAAREIKGLISASKNEVDEGVDLVGRTGDAFERIIAQVGEIYTAVSEIAVNAQDQSMRLAEVNSAVMQMDQATQKNAGVAAESNEASAALAQETQQLSVLVGSFQLSSQDEATFENEARSVGGSSDIKGLQQQLTAAYPTSDKRTRQPLTLNKARRANR